MAHNHLWVRVRGIVRALLSAATVLCALLVGATSADASPPPPKPPLLAQAPFVIPATTGTGRAITVKATVWHFPTTAEASDVVAWLTCQSTAIPSAYPLVKVVDHSTGRLVLISVVTSSTFDTNCMLSAVPKALGTHISFFPFDVDPEASSVETDALYVIDGVTVP